MPGCGRGNGGQAGGLEISGYPVNVALRFRVRRNAVVLVDSPFAGVVRGDRLRIIALVIVEQKTEVADTPLDVFPHVENVRDPETPAVAGINC